MPKFYYCCIASYVTVLTSTNV